MFENERTIYYFQRQYMKNMLSDISEEEMTKKAFPGSNTPAWIVGHLAVAQDRGLGMFNEPGICPEGWSKLFGKGSSPRAENGPSKEELLAVFKKSADCLRVLTENADEALMNRPHGLANFANGPLRTAGDFVAMLMTGHLSIHLGQLSYWRRAMGRAPII